MFLICRKDNKKVWNNNRLTHFLFHIIKSVPQNPIPYFFANTKLNPYLCPNNHKNRNAMVRIADPKFECPMNETQVESLFKKCLEDKVDEMLTDKKNAEDKVAEQAKIIHSQALELEKLRSLLKQHGLSS